MTTFTHDAPDSNPTKDTSQINMSQISTMTLDEFRNLLNTTLSVPNSEPSQSGSESPVSLSGSDSSRRTSALSPRNRNDDANANRRTKNTISKSIGNDGACDNERPRLKQAWGSGTKSSETKMKRALPKSPQENNNNSTAALPTSVAYRSRTPGPREEIPRPNSPSIRQISRSSTPGPRDVTPSRDTIRSRSPAPGYRPRSSTPCRESPPKEKQTAFTTTHGSSTVGQRESALPRSTTSEIKETNKGSGIPRPNTPSKFGSMSSIPAPSSERIRRSSTPGPQPCNRIQPVKRSVTPGPRGVYSRPATLGSAKILPSDTNDANGRGRSMDLSPQNSGLRQRSASSHNLAFTTNGMSAADNVEHSVDIAPQVRGKISLPREHRRGSEGIKHRSMSRSGSSESGDAGEHNVSLVERSPSSARSAERISRSSRRESTNRDETPSQDSSHTQRRNRAQSAEPRTVLAKRPPQDISRTNKQPVYQTSITQRKRSNSEQAIVVDEGANQRRPSAGSKPRGILRANTPHDREEQTRRKLPNPRRAMTPNSFSLRDDTDLDSRSLDEIKAALRIPLDGEYKITTETLAAPPEDADMFHKMEELFLKFQEKELNSPSYSNGGDMDIECIENDIGGSFVDSFVDSNANIKIEKGAPKKHKDTAIIPPMTQSIPRKEPEPEKESMKSPDLLDDCNDTSALILHIKEILKTRPRRYSKSDLKTRIPAPASKQDSAKDKCSDTFKNISLPSCSNEKSSFICDLDSSLKQNDSLCELSRISNCDLSVSISDSSFNDSYRSETPVPKLASPLITGRSTFCNGSKDRNSNGPKLVRATSLDQSFTSTFHFTPHRSVSVDDEDEIY